jgi:membrane-bound serine protease (ClpP class)
MRGGLAADDVQWRCAGGLVGEHCRTPRDSVRARSMHRLGNRVVLVAIAVVWLLGAAAVSGAQPATPVVYVAPIEGIIDLGLAPFVERVLKEAVEANAAAVVLEIDTFGGRVDAAVLIRDALIEAQVPTVAFINKRAISAGALISLAAERMAMAEGSTIGAATPVQMGQGGSEAVGEKTVSYVRKEFRATAEARGRPPLVAEAMVDADVEIEGLIEKGKLLTLTTTEALEHKVADFRANTFEAVLEQLELEDAEIRRPALNWAEHVVRFLTHPILSSVLMTVGLLGIIVELRTPGFGIPGMIGVASLAAFFWGHWLVRLAGWEEIMLVAAGLVLLAIELFVIPGFGIAGVLGILALGTGLTLSLVGAGATPAFVIAAVSRVLASLIMALVAFFVVLRYVPRLPFARGLVLQSGLGALTDYLALPEDERRWLGKRGTAETPLRPAGIADLEGERVDVVSQGEYIEVGEPILVIRVEGNRIVVRRDRGRPTKE